ncbi:MAG TPA: FkbM family methyltransferase [Steroidobacteraceae bacterium]|nr:FkbM family methyltransferase [Steroidobacteraceae bacterium]
MLLNSLGSLFSYIQDHHSSHARSTNWYQFTNSVVKAAFAEAKPEFEAGKPVPICELGEINLPYKTMGAVDTLDLFGLDELIIFAYYLKNKGVYKNALDIGANLGLHSIVLGKLGYSVAAYEPDPSHYSILKGNLELNGVAESVVATQAAISDSKGSLEFVRVLGNTTGSHLAGSKSSPYGALDRFPVDAIDIKSIIGPVGLAKIDAEGHEVVLLKAINWEQWSKVDAFVEIGTPANASEVFDYFAKSPINIFSQKTGWQKVVSVTGMPTSHREGSIFITGRPAMSW